MTTKHVPATPLREKATAFGAAAAAKQFEGRTGHGGNPQLAERHLTQQQLAVLMAAAFEAGANLAYPLLVEVLIELAACESAYQEQPTEGAAYHLDRAMQSARVLLRSLGEDA